MLICTCFATTGESAVKARETLQKLIEKKPSLVEIVETSDFNIFKSKEKDSDKTALQRILIAKPEFSEEINKIMASVDEDDASKDSEVDEETESFLNMHNVSTVRQTIKDQSLFNQHFIDIAQNVQSESVSYSEQENILFNPKFVEFLLEYFMPYCGIWAGFVFQEIQTKKQEEFTRITNGLIEKFWQYRKNKFKVIQQPANYVVNTLNSTKGQATVFVENLEKGSVSSDSESDSGEHEDSNDEEKNVYAHKDCWDKKPQSKTALKRKKKTNVGYYQLPKTIKRFKASDDGVALASASATATTNVAPASKESIGDDSTVATNANQIVHTIDDIEIKSKDFDSLNGENLLTDTIILAYMKTFISSNNVYLFSSNVAAQIVEIGKTLSAIRKNLNVYKYAAGPVHIPGIKHWCLLFVSLETNDVTYIDPYQASDTKCEQVRLNWTKFCKTRSGLKEKEWRVSPYSFSHKKQTDEFSCGVFVCYFFEKLIKADYNYMQNYFDVADYRTIIRKQILSN